MPISIRDKKTGKTITPGMDGKKTPAPISKSKAFADYRKKHGYSHKADPKHPMNAEGKGVVRKKSGGEAKKKMPTGPKPRPTQRERDKAKRTSTLIGQIDEVMNPGGRAARTKRGEGSRNVPALSEVLQGAYRYGKEKVKDMSSPMKKGGPVKVKSGDTLSQIAKSKGVTLKALLAANPNIKNANQIRVGQSIKIPGAAAGAGAKSKNPYKGMTKTQMNMMDVKNKDRKKQTAATRSMQVQGKYGASPTSPSSESKKKIEDRSGFEAAKNRARSRMTASQKKQNDATTSKIKSAGSKAIEATKKALSFTPAVKGATAAKSVAKSIAKKANSLPTDTMKKDTRATKKRRPAIPSNDIAAKNGGQMKRYAGGGTVRGAGAATKGKRFGRCG